jgi:hypothetical protein
VRVEVGIGSGSRDMTAQEDQGRTGISLGA